MEDAVVALVCAGKLSYEQACKRLKINLDADGGWLGSKTKVYDDFRKTVNKHRKILKKQEILREKRQHTELIQNFKCLQEELKQAHEQLKSQQIIIVCVHILLLYTSQTLFASCYSNSH